MTLKKTFITPTVAWNIKGNWKVFSSSFENQWEWFSIRERKTVL